MSIEQKIRSRLASVPGCFKLKVNEGEQLETELKQVLARIRTFESALDASREFDRLEQYQETLATLFFRFDADLTLLQQFVVRKFDRGDDPVVREHLFMKLKSYSDMQLKHLPD